MWYKSNIRGIEHFKACFYWIEMIMDLLSMRCSACTFSPTHADVYIYIADMVSSWHGGNAGILGLDYLSLLMTTSFVLCIILPWIIIKIIYLYTNLGSQNSMMGKNNNPVSFFYTVDYSTRV